MTDVLSPPTADVIPDELDPPAKVVWLPAKEPRKGRHVALWLGIPGGVAAAGAALCSAILIAPGVMAAGIDVGWSTPGSASVLVDAALADTVITLKTPSRDITLTGQELGLSVDALAITELAYGEYPLWKVGSWNPGNLPIAVNVDSDAALAAISAAAPSVFTAPVNGGVKFDSQLDEFRTITAESGLGVNLDKLAAAVSNALSAGSRAVSIDADPIRIDPAISTAAARQQASALNDLIDSAGFSVGGEEVFGFDPADAASWLTVTAVDGALKVDVDTDAVMADTWKVVAALPRTVNRPAVDEVIVTNSAGDHLRTVQAGADGWKLGATAGVAAAFVRAFAAGDSAYELDVTDVAYTTTLSFRSIEVNKTTGQTILYENGQVVDTFSVAIGQPGTPTPEGRFTVFAQLEVQDMGCVPGYDYCTKGVPWITYFSGDNGFHGTYWHDNFGAGAMMSHGCVNMTISAAERVYYFAQTGTEVWVHP